MIGRIKKYFRDVRINLDFPQYERRCRPEHEKQAERRFSTSALEGEMQKFLENIMSRASEKFDALINKKEAEKECFQSHTINTECMLYYFKRFYKQELDELYKEKNELSSRKCELYDKNNQIRNLISEAYEEKDKAYSNLNYYKDRIDSWYRESARTPWLLGNEGKKLPKHSLFGQSFGDLDSYKYHRDSAYKDVREAKNQIGSLKEELRELSINIGRIKNEIGELFQQISEVKSDRSKMYELKHSGHNKINLQAQLDNDTSDLNRVMSEISELENKKTEYISMQKHRYGINTLESKIRDIRQRKRQFMESFDLIENHKTRIRLHREAWLKQRGKD